MPSILITGAARGFGRALCDCFNDAGWRVFALVRADADARAMNGAGGEGITAFAADVCSDDAGERIREVLEAEGGALDVLVNNAGRSGAGMSIESLEREQLESMLDLHCVGAMRCARAALPFLERAPRALLVNVSSRLGSLANNAAGAYRNARFSYDYRIAKAAQNMLTLCLSAELAGGNVSVCALHPGRLRTATGSDDADTEPQASAQRFLRFVDGAGPKVNGRFIDLFGGEIPW